MAICPRSTKFLCPQFHIIIAAYIRGYEKVVRLTTVNARARAHDSSLALQDSASDLAELLAPRNAHAVILLP